MLQRFAELASQEMRSSDVLARWSGEEFLWVMPDTTAQQALGVLARLREHVHVRPADLQPPWPLRFSAGVAECPALSNLDAAIERADAAMYRAKQAGRDRALQAA